MRSFKIKQNEGSCLRTEIFDGSFSICKAADFSGVDLSEKYTFTGVSDEEKSLICRTENVPADLTKHIAAVSTYNTDYIFVREEDLGKAADALAGAGYKITPERRI